MSEIYSPYPDVIHRATNVLPLSRYDQWMSRYDSIPEYPKTPKSSRDPLILRHQERNVFNNLLEWEDTDSNVQVAGVLVSTARISRVNPAVLYGIAADVELLAEGDGEYGALGVMIAGGLLKMPEVHLKMIPTVRAHMQDQFAPLIGPDFGNDAVELAVKQIQSGMSFNSWARDYLARRKRENV
ncbi:MAG TPA: hypothetical protein VG965_01900 [Patescibacteria group bacterium]|nr:hypothetical protein [Patescibacteria group bacterium]